MDSQDGSSGPVTVISRSEEYESKWFGQMIIIFLIFLLTRYAIFAANLALKLAEVIEMPRINDYLSTLSKPLDSPWTSILLDWVMLPAFLLLSSLFILMLVYTAEILAKEPETTLENLTIEIWKRLKNVGAAAKLFVCFLPLGYLSFSLSLTLAVLLLGSFAVGFYFLASLLTISSLVFVVYYDFVWFQRVLVLAMETGCEGLALRENSSGVVDEKKELPIRVKFKLAILPAIVAVCNSMTMYKLGKWEIGGLFVVSFIPFWNLSLMEAVGLTVHEMFYPEWRSGRVEELGTEETPVHDRVPSAASSREDVP